MPEPGRTPARGVVSVAAIAIVALVAAVGSVVVGARPASASYTVRPPSSPWRATVSPDHGTGDNQLYGVSCTSSTTCVAVGSEALGGGTGALIEVLAGGSWTVVPSPSLTGEGTLYGVSCVSAVECVAVGAEATDAGGRALIETWHGSTWTVTPTPALGSAGSFLQGVSCTQTAGVAACDAVGYLYLSGRAQLLVMATTGGAAWRVVATPPVDSVYGILNAVSCTGATACVAVGYDEVSGVTEALALTLSGTTWSSGPDTGRERGSSLSGVSCPSATDCVAVGDVATGSEDSRTLVESWNGTAWSVAPSPDPGSRGDLLAGVSCPTATDCVAGGSSTDGSGNRTMMASWAGTTWSDTPSPDPGTDVDYVTAVSCVSIDSCRAVGTATTGAATDRTLALSFELPPPVIAEVSFRGGAAHPRITITGSGFGTEPVGAATGCGTTGTDYPGADLGFQDVQTGWGAGSPGNCLGLVVSHYTATRISYSFGSAYGTGHPPLDLSASDAFTVSVDGATCSEIVPKPSSMSRRPGSGAGGPPARVTTLAVVALTSSTSCA